MYTRISDKVVGILLRAKKYGLLYFEPEMLFQVEGLFLFGSRFGSYEFPVEEASGSQTSKRDSCKSTPFFVAGAARRRPRRDDEADARDLLRVQPERQDLRHARPRGRRRQLGFRGKGPPAQGEMTPEMDRQDLITKPCSFDHLECWLYVRARRRIMDLRI